MTEINRKNFVLFFKLHPIQLFSVIFVLLCVNYSGKFDNLIARSPAGSLAENDGKKYQVSETQITLL